MSQYKTGTVAVTTGSDTAIVTIAGQPYLYVQNIDVAGKKIYCSPNATASAGEAWLIGAGTFPVSKNGKLWGVSGGGGPVLNLAGGSFVTAIASTDVSVAKTEFGNVDYITYSEAFSLSCRAFLTSSGDTAYDGFVVVNSLKR